MKVLIVKLSSMGDLIHTLPALADLKLNLPGVQIDWLVESSMQNIPAWQPAVIKVIPINLRKFTLAKLPALFKALKMLREESYDLVIDGQGLIKSAILARCARAKIITGYAKCSVREKLAAYLYHKKIRVAKDLHAIDRLRVLLAQTFAYHVDLARPVYDLPWHKIDALPYTAQSLGTFGQYVVFLHGTTWESKHWPDEYWHELALLVKNIGYKVVMTSANAQQLARVQAIAQNNPAVIVVPPLTINQMVGILRQASAAVSVDTGFGHLASAIDIPVLGLYGPTNPLKAGMCASTNAQNLVSDFDCVFCAKRICSYQRSVVSPRPVCLGKLNPRIVFAKLQAMLPEA